jgi:uncharacterized protein
MTLSGIIPFIALLLFFGWVLFSLAAGMVVYFSTMTTDLASIETTKMMEAEKKSALNAHTKDPAVMEPLLEAKERWIKARLAGAWTVLSVKSRDGLSLSGYYHPASHEGGCDKTVLLVHGMMDSAAGLAYLWDQYRRRGWAVLSIDLRAHGESEGTKRTMGVLESQDLGLWVSLLVDEYGASNITIHGVSMGATTALMYAMQKSGIPHEVSGIISDSCFVSHYSTMIRLLHRTFRNRVLAISVAWGASLSSFLCTGAGFGQMNVKKNIARLKIPVLFFHGQADVLIPLDTVYPFFLEAMKRSSELVVIPSAPHIGTYFYAPDLYMDKIEDFTGSH